MGNKDNNNFNYENPPFEPIPQPLPELKNSGSDGGFRGVANRFCSDRVVAPVEEMPDFTIGEDRPNREKLKVEEAEKETPAENIISKEFSAENNTIPQEEQLPTEICEDEEEKIITIPTTSQPTEMHQQPRYETQKYATVGKFDVPVNNTKKTKTPLVIFITVIVTVMIVTAGFFVFYNMYPNEKGNPQNPLEDIYPDNGNSQIAVENYGNDFNAFADEVIENTKTPSVQDSNKNSNDLTQEKWKGLYINKKAPAKKGDAQSAYNKVYKSTVAVMCYQGEVTDDAKPDGQGTGIIISDDGYIVTNSHVIGNSKTAYNYEIVDCDGKKFTADVVGYDTRTDLAVLKIKGSDLQEVTFADVSTLNIGDDIIAVGNPGGIDFQNSLTKGILSAKERSLDDTSVKYIQTDAAVNPGNSGGPLCNLSGEVVGITTAKINSSIYEGMGFAIPSDTVKAVVDDIIKMGYVSNRVRIGITGIALSPQATEAFNIPSGILVAEVSKDGSLADTKVQKKDIITNFDGEDITSFEQLYSLLEKHKPGDEVDIKIFRYNKGSDSEEFTVTVKLVADKGETQS